jgi:transcriptional regulator with XRE-family HTH domain
MEKTIYSDEYLVVIQLLKELRKAAGLTQIQMADKLSQTQSLYSKYERGEIRLDVIQLRTITSILGLTLTEFSEKLEQRLTGQSTRQPKRRRPST